MRIYRDRIEITRGETWEYDVDIVNNDGSPYIISSKLNHPYFLLTIASSVAYSEATRYVHNFWCEIDDSYKKFYVTTPIEVIADTITNNIAPEDALDEPLADELASYVASGKDATTYAVYKTKDKNEYWYWNGSKYETYTAPEFSILFTSEQMMELVEREYDFALKVVAGQEVIRLPNRPTPSRPLPNQRRLVKIEYMQRISVPEKLIVVSNIYGSMEV